MSAGFRVTEKGWRLAAAEFVKERDQAWADVARLTEALLLAREDARRASILTDEREQERDQARRAARICFKWRGGQPMSDSPQGMIHDLEFALDVEDYTKFPEWLTGARR